MSITYAPLTTAHLFAACELMNHAYARQKSPDYFQWLYFENAQPSYLWGAFENSQLIGIAGLVIRPLTNDATIGVVMDILVKESHRGQGIFKQLLDAMIADVTSKKRLDALGSFTNELGMSALTKGLGWKVVTQIDTLTLDMTTAKVKSVPQSNMHIDRITFDVDENYMNWRFKHSPLYAYEMSESSVGVVVTKIFQDPLTAQVFGDIVFLKPNDMNETSVKGLLQTGIKQLKKQQVSQITTWALPDSLRFFACEEQGFLSKTQPRYWCLSVRNPMFGSLTDATIWDVQQADSEVF